MLFVAVTNLHTYLIKQLKFMDFDMSKSISKRYHFLSKILNYENIFVLFNNLSKISLKYLKIGVCNIYQFCKIYKGLHLSSQPCLNLSRKVKSYNFFFSKLTFFFFSAYIFRIYKNRNYIPCQSY